MIFPISRQGLEQIALILAVGAIVFIALAAWRRRQGAEWRRSATSAGFLGGLVAVALGLAYTVAPNIPTPPVPVIARFARNPTPDTPETIAAGRGLYERNCAICHGIGGRGDGPAALTLNPRPFDLIIHVPQHAQGEIHYWITQGIGGTSMPGWPQLTDTERWQIVRHLYDLASRAR